VSRSFELFQLASVQMSQQHGWTLSVYDKEKDFTPKHRFGKTAATVWTMCVPVQMLSLIRQVVQKKFNSLDVSLYGLDAQALIWK
jgi:hypothetical protein